MFEHIKQRDNVRVVECGDRLRFPNVTPTAPVQDLDSYLPRQAVITSAIALSELSRTDSLAKNVAPDLYPGPEHNSG